MKLSSYLIILSLLFMQGCTYDYHENEMCISNKNGNLTYIGLPEEIENFGKAVAVEIKTTVCNMIERGVDYSDIPDSIDFRERFYEDWYAANHKTKETRSIEMNIPFKMNPSEFTERYNMLTVIQIKYINKIIKECERSISNSDLLERLIDLKSDICLHVPEYERERLFYVISVLYYGIQMVMELDSDGLMLNTPYSHNKLQFSRIKTRAESVTGITVPEECRSFLVTVWTIAIGEPTPAGDIVASIATVYVGGLLMYEVIACSISSSEVNNNRDYCINKYIECINNNPDWAKDNSGGYGYTMCRRCQEFCDLQGYWSCPRPI